MKASHKQKPLSKSRRKFPAVTYHSSIHFWAYPDTKVLDLDLNQAHSSMRGSSTAAMVLVPAAASSWLAPLPASDGVGVLDKWFP